MEVLLNDKQKEVVEEIDALMEKYNIGIWYLKRFDQHECPRE